MSRRRIVALLFALSLVVAAPAQADRDRDRPSRVVIIVLDQARPDTIERYGMKNVQKLQREGMNFPNALVGHMAAETVISHNVLTSGLFPKNMGWTNEVYRDTDGVLTPPGGYHVTSSMGCGEYGALIRHGRYRKIQDYLDAKFGPDSVFASISQKRSSACTAGHTGMNGAPTDREDVIFQIRSSNSTPNCDPADPGVWRLPEDGNGGSASTYFPELATPCNRWVTWQQSGAYGTAGPDQSPANIYPLDGNRFVPGFNDEHYGGDVWSADAAIRVIQRPSPWHGMMVSLGGIDKLGHMWGPEDEQTGPPGSIQEMRHLPFIAKTADEQVGRIVDALRKRGILDETLIVVTADHAAQTGEGDRFHGDLAPVPCAVGLRSDCNWYYGSEAPTGGESYETPSQDLQPLVTRLGSNLRFTYQDGHMGLWLNGDSDAQKREAAAAVLDLPHMIASFRINAAHNDYRLHGTNRMSGRERAWFARHGEELVDTMAHRSGPEVVGLMETDVTWGVKGDHGGHNKLIQNIPMVLYGAGVGSKDSNREMRHVDVMPTILEAMGIDYDEDSLDGEAVRLSRHGGGRD
jgi:hypothetical protein